ncbi:MAG: hypothetical protein ACRDP6_32035 [Actinoallomurus sp.]
MPNTRRLRLHRTYKRVFDHQLGAVGAPATVLGGGFVLQVGVAAACGRRD